MRETMKSTRRVALVGTTDVSLVPALAAEFARCGRNCFFLAASSLPQLRNQVVRGVPQVIVLDESILDGSATEEVFYALTAAAPVVFVASQETLISAAPLAADGDIECVARAGQYIPLAAAIVERRLRWLERAHASLGPPWAELLLAHRENLPAAAAQRLETVVDLAIRLRETVRRLSQMWESHHPAARSA
jgi:hypothetical protein